jgi:hypothetical protein
MSRGVLAETAWATQGRSSRAEILILHHMPTSAISVPQR